MDAAGQGHSAQQQQQQQQQCHGVAPYPPQQQYYAQQPSQPQYQQYNHQQQYYQPYQPPQQPQYYYPPQQQQQQQQPYASLQAAAPQAPQQHFLAELDASSSTTPAAKPPAQTQHGTPGAGPVFEMSAEATAHKPGDASKPQTVTAAAATSPPPPPPPVQANPWGFFLPENDLPERSGSVSPAKESLADDQTLAVKPLRIVKTGPVAGSPGGRPQDGGAREDDAPQLLRPAAPETGGSPDDEAQLTPEPLSITHPQPAAPSASQLPYPVDGAGILTPGSHPAPQPGAQFTLPVRPAANGSPLYPASPTALAPSPLTPSPTAAVPPLPQQPQQHYQVAPQPVYTQASPVSPVLVQASLPPTLPMGSYFPQQPSYARPETTAWPAQPPASAAHHSPAPSVSSTATTAQPGPQTGQHSPAQPYTSPPPSYNQTVTQSQPATASPTSLPQFPQPPAPAQPLSPNPTGVPLPMSPPPSQYPYSPSCVGADRFGFNQNQPPPAPQQQPYNAHASPPIPQASYISGPQSYHPTTSPPLPPRPSPPTPVQYGQHPAPSPSPSPYGGPLPPTRPSYQAPPPRPDSRLFSSAMARKLLSKTTELVDQTITPLLQDHRPRPLYNAYQYATQHRPPSAPQAQYHHQQGHAPSQLARTDAFVCSYICGPARCPAEHRRVSSILKRKAMRDRGSKSEARGLEAESCQMAACES
ncbi:hypothetical protein LX36DRAFT_671753 [Colletotrichum falcatum]|nr:hypothetical protein LX36DRAFT_671753 [Colletotrichum falcatum]